jgi:glycosyltransferase involved in cell wall biosynthesis
MRIALFTETFLPKVDGVVNTLCHLLDHLSLREHESLLFAPEGGPARYADTRVLGLAAYGLPGYRELKLAPPWVNATPMLEQFKPDLIHLVNPFTFGRSGLQAAQKLAVPTVASYHTDLPGFLRRWHLGALSSPVNAYVRMLHNRADLNLCPSRTTKQMLEGAGFKRVKVWKRGVDTVRFNPGKRSMDWRKRLSGGEVDKTLLLYVGRLSFEKRVDWLRPVLDAVDNAHLAIVGDGPARGKLQKLFSSTPTTFTGYLHGEDLSHAYASADIFAFASQYETVGNVILEAMASGLAVIAPRSGGLLDHVTHGKTGLLFDKDDQNELVDVARHLCTHRVRAQAMGREGRTYTESLDWTSTLDEVLDEYRNTIEGRFSPLKQAKGFLQLFGKAWTTGSRETG